MRTHLLLLLLLQNAFKCYTRSRDYCTTPKHIVSMCLSVIRVAVEMGNFMHVANHVSKAEAAPDVQVCTSIGVHCVRWTCVCVPDVQMCRAGVHACAGWWGA